MNGPMRTPPMQDATLIEALSNATSLELYQLAALVERLMGDPRRIVAIRKDLHLGQTVRFYEARHDRLLLGRIVDLRDTSLTVQASEYRGEWKLPYAAIEPPEPGAKAPAAAPAPPSTPRPTRADFSRGAKVSFTDRSTSASSRVATPRRPASIATVPRGACPTQRSGTCSTFDRAHHGRGFSDSY